MYTVIGNSKSRTLRVLWLLEELGLEYEHVSASPRSPDVVALNPSGKVPVLVTEDTPITDSTAILSFLADRHGAFTYLDEVHGVGLYGRGGGVAQAAGAPAPSTRTSCTRSRATRAAGS